MPSPADDVRTTNDQVVRDLFAAGSARDYERFAQFLAEDIEFDLAYTPEMLPMPTRGRDAVRELVENILGGMFDPFRIEVVQTYDGADPEILVAEYRSDAVVKHNGNAYRNRYVGIFRIRDGTIVFWREYHDPEQATRALG